MRAVLILTGWYRGKCYFAPVADLAIGVIFIFGGFKDEIHGCK